MSNKTKFVCFGEILWDVFPNYKHLGGAPLNVALRLASLCPKDSVQIISAIGNDPLGMEALTIIKKSKINSANIQINQFATGTVKVTVSKAGNASYSIASNAAWDYIAVTPQALAAFQKDSVFVFGSLAARSKVSSETLKMLINAASFTVFDVNLRTPFYDLDTIFETLKQVDFIKMNDDELDLICKHFKGPKTTLKEQLQWLRVQSAASYICVTLGAQGACLFTQNHFIKVPGVPTKVIDTVGAGDSFLATLLWALFQNKDSAKKALTYACAMGALVAASSGANPKIELSELKCLVDNS